MADAINDDPVSHNHSYNDDQKSDEPKSGDSNTGTSSTELEDGHAASETVIKVPKTKVDQDMHDTDKKEESPGLSSYFRIFKRYSEPRDHFLRLCGFVAACTAGVALPLMTIVFGSSVDQLNDFGAGVASSSELYNGITKNALWFLYLFVGRFVLIYIHTTCFGISGIRATRALRLDFIKSLIRQDITYLDSCSPGTVATTVSNNADMVENGVGEKIGSMIMAISMLLSAFIVAFTRQWALTLVTATTLPALFAGFFITFSLDAGIEAKILKIYSAAGGLVEEAMGTIRIVAAFDASQKLRRKYDVYLDEAQKLGFKKGPILGVQYSVEFFTMFCAYALAWFYGIKLLVEGNISSGGQMVTVLLAVLLGTTAMSAVAPGMGDFSRSSAAAKGMFEIIDRKSTIDPLSDSGERPIENGDQITLRNVSFAYPSRPTIKVLQDIKITFESGKVTALVGASGSGKSTIVGLIERWFDPNSGSVDIGNYHAKDLNIRWLRRQIGLVQQEPILFSDTIYNNVAHGLYGTEMDQLPEEEKRELVRQACIQAYADDFIQELPEKYDTKVGDRGGFLSGGQKQRVAIARSVIGNPRILLLDEATSALDPTAEKKVQAALDNVSKSRTTIVIAHKLSTIQNADKIVVINRGEVVEQGTHQQLLAQKGAYHKLVNAQNLNTRQANMEDVSSLSLPTEEISNEKDEEKILPETMTTSSRPSMTAEEQIEAQEKDISRKFSLVRCLCIIFKEQNHLWPLFLAGSLGSIGVGGMFPAQAVLFGNSIVALQIPVGPILRSQGNFWALMYFVLGLGVLASSMSLGMFFTIAAFHATRFYRSEYFDSMLRQDISFFDVVGHSAAEMTSRLSSDPQRLQDLLSTNFGMILIVIVNISSSCILSLVLGWQLALVVIVGCMPPLFLAGFTRMRLEMTNQDRLSMEYLESSRFATEAVGAIRTVSSLTLEEKVLQNYKVRLENSAQSEVRQKLKSMILFALSESVELGAAGLAFWYGGKLLSEGKYDVKTFFIVFIAIILGSQAAGFLFGFTSNTTKAHAAANHIIDLQRSQPPINTSTGIKEISAKEKEAVIEFKNVCFEYPSRPHLSVLRNINLKINKGESVGIVGASGCGKSTMVALLERFYDITSGELLLHNTPLKELDVHYHRSRIGMVSQETILYQGTIRDNVLLGIHDQDANTDGDNSTSSAVDEKVIQACKSANIHDFITSLPSGYSTQIGNRGVSLSGGQRQRLAIARALIREPDILLFDEATSALDTASEAVVQAAIETIARDNPGRTTIAVAHRLSTIKRCDRIFVLHRGQVVEEGNHETLVSAQGKYYEMVLAQTLDQEVD